MSEPPHLPLQIEKPKHDRAPYMKSHGIEPPYMLLNTRIISRWLTMLSTNKHCPNAGCDDMLPKGRWCGRDYMCFALTQFFSNTVNTWLLKGRLQSLWIQKAGHTLKDNSETTGLYPIKIWPFQSYKILKKCKLDLLLYKNINKNRNYMMKIHIIVNEGL